MTDSVAGFTVHSSSVRYRYRTSPTCLARPKAARGCQRDYGYDRERPERCNYTRARCLRRGRSGRGCAQAGPTRGKTGTKLPFS